MQGIERHCQFSLGKVLLVSTNYHSSCQQSTEICDLALSFDLYDSRASVSEAKDSLQKSFPLFCFVWLTQNVDRNVWALNQ